LLDLSLAAPDPTIVLEDIAEAQWIPLANRAPIIQKILDAKLTAVAKAEGLEQENAKTVLWTWQLRRVKYLSETKQYSRAAEEVAALRKNTTVSDSAALVPYEMQCAAQLGTLDTILSGYKSEPQGAPSAESLRMPLDRFLKAAISNRPGKSWNLCSLGNWESTSWWRRISLAWPKFGLRMATWRGQSLC